MSAATVTCPVCPDIPGHLVVELATVRCVDCQTPVAEWDQQDPLYRPGRTQCPGCIRADIDEDRAATRREDQ